MLAPHSQTLTILARLALVCILALITITLPSYIPIWTTICTLICPFYQLLTKKKCFDQNAAKKWKGKLENIISEAKNASKQTLS